MNWPFFKKTVEQSRVYLGLFLKEDSGAAFLIYQEGRSARLGELEKISYPKNLDHLTETVDEALFKLENRSKRQINEVIFFVYSNFLDENSNLKKEYTPVIKGLIKNLELKPLGYIESYEAVSSFIQKKDEILLSAIMVELDRENTTVFVYKSGKLNFRTIIKKGANLAQDLESVLSKLKDEMLLPTRIILYDSFDLDDEVTRIVSHQFADNIFIQLPKVEIVGEHDVVDGFVQVFNSQLTKKKEVEVPNVDIEEKEVEGFLIGADIAKSYAKVPAKTNVLTSLKVSLPIEAIRQKLAQLLVRLKKSFSYPVAAISGLIIILLVLFIDQYFFHQATLTLFLPSQAIARQLDLIGSLNRDPNSLLIKVATTSAAFSDTENTSGSRDIGEKAKGTVTIYNYDDQQRSISQGTRFVGAGLAFFLQDDVKIASSSESSPGVKVAGKSQATLQAADIGPGGNIDKGVRFVIDNVSQQSAFALNDVSFTGGTKKTIKTTAQKDLDTAESAILTKAKVAPPGKATGLNTAHVKAIDSLTDVVLSDVRPSKEIGEEANEVTLTATALTTNYLYDTDEFLDYLGRSLNDQIPKGFTLPKNNIVYTISSAKVQKNGIGLTVKVHASAIKQVNLTDVKKQLAMKPTNSLSEFLKNRYGVLGYKLTNHDYLPLFNWFLPLFSKNITLVVSSL